MNSTLESAETLILATKPTFKTRSEYLDEFMSIYRGFQTSLSKSEKMLLRVWCLRLDDCERNHDLEIKVKLYESI